MALANYGDLLTAIETWLDRSDSPVTANAADFITLCEERIRTDIKTFGQESVTALSVSTEYVSLPSDPLMIRHADIDGSPDQALSYLTPQQMALQDANESNKPRSYSLVGNQIQLYPVPDTTYTMNISYVRAYDNFDTTTATNDLLTNYPSIYLYGSLLEANIFLMDEEQATKYQVLFNDKVEKVNRTEKHKKYPTPLKQRVVGRTP
jgi:hypothetical protein